MMNDCFLEKLFNQLYGTNMAEFFQTIDLWHLSYPFCHKELSRFKALYPLQLLTYKYK